jgi:hypothetical protein
MFRVRAEFPRGGLSITDHLTAVDTQARVRELRRWGARSFIENDGGEPLSDRHLEELVIEEARHRFVRLTGASA